jgi:hypothetical protein
MNDSGISFIIRLTHFPWADTRFETGSELLTVKTTQINFTYVGRTARHISNGEMMAMRVDPLVT